MNNIESIWFYTFSTSAQVLAALTGLFSVFVVYKIQNLSVILDDIKGVAIHFIVSYSKRPNYSDQEEKFENIIDLSDEDLLKKFEGLLIKHEELPEQDRFNDNSFRAPILCITYGVNRETYGTLLKLAKQKKDIINDLVKVLTFSMLVVIYEIICLSAANVSVQYFGWLLTMNIFLIIGDLGMIGFKTYTISSK